MATADPTGQDWTDHEVDLIVADYFSMLKMELLGQTFVKSQRNADLQGLTGRKRGSIEFKHQNISAVLMELSIPWLQGYRPKSNYQRRLVDGVERFLSSNNDYLPFSKENSKLTLLDEQVLYIESPPNLSVRRSAHSPILKRLLRKFDPAARDARNRTLGRQGEERVYYSEKTRLAQEGRQDLANKVRWISEEDGDGAGYDILSFDRLGAERLLEVKTTPGHQTTPFYISENERRISVEQPDTFRIMRVYDFFRSPKAFMIAPPLEDAMRLDPIQFRASF